MLRIIIFLIFLYLDNILLGYDIEKYSDDQKCRGVYFDAFIIHLF